MVVERFLSWMMSAPADKRVEATSALARAYLHMGLGEDDLEMADAVMTVLLDDPCIDVRRALAEALASHPDAPRHVMFGLAADTAEIAALVLSRSPVFADAELVDVVAGGTPEQIVAIACRRNLSAVVAAAIAEIGEREACMGLIANDGADLRSSALHRMAERFGADAEIRGSILRHPRIRPRTRVLLIEKLAEAVESRMAGRIALPASRVGELARQNCDKAIIAYAAEAGDDDLDEIVDALIEAGRMTAAFLLRAICTGHVSLFARAMARLADVPVSRVETVLADDRRTVLLALYRKAGLPDLAFEAFSNAIGAWRDLLASCDTSDSSRMSYLVTRRVLASYQGSTSAELDTLFVLLRKLAAETARDHARREIDRIAARARGGEPLALAAPRQEEDAGRGSHADDTIKLPGEVITAFALHFAEELVDLEEELAMRAQAPESAQAARAATGPANSHGDDIAMLDEEIELALQSLDIDDIELPDDAANDDVPAVGVDAAGGSLPREEGPSLGLLELARVGISRREAA